MDAVDGRSKRFPEGRVDVGLHSPSLFSLGLSLRAEPMSATPVIAVRN